MFKSESLAGQQSSAGVCNGPGRGYSKHLTNDPPVECLTDTSDCLSLLRAS